MLKGSTESASNASVPVAPKALHSQKSKRERVSCSSFPFFFLCLLFYKLYNVCNALQLFAICNFRIIFETISSFVSSGPVDQATRRSKSALSTGLSLLKHLQCNLLSEIISLSEYSTLKVLLEEYLSLSLPLDQRCSTKSLSLCEGGAKEISNFELQNICFNTIKIFIIKRPPNLHRPTPVRPKSSSSDWSILHLKAFG